ncbi:1-acyl-sn-glycerol-3-phosphate acyltransferase [uncultured Polaribacter sp.]|uniref:lysophospholipid acyltransferase family protein n=1 Tax=uncultured Polaribacter sp. TaxID=174711 RepID=UPI002607BE9A|nr:lysophospholipid acyltransferase family protein [uncultured Polaribacter sp.]
MKFFKIPFLLIWRFWFYLLLFTSILILSPFLLVFTLDFKYYHRFWAIARIISKILVYGMGFRINFKEVQKIEADKSYMFCPNHTSLLDPFILIALSKNPIVFVGKKELVKIPIFGFFYKKVVIMVDRSSAESKKRVFKMAKERLQNGVSMAIFPEGLVPEENVILAPFKKGAFSLAIEFEIPIVPQTYYDCKRFFSWDIYKGGPGVIRVKQHKFIPTKNMHLKEDLIPLKDKTFAILKQDLENDKAYMKDTNRKNERKIKL